MDLKKILITIRANKGRALINALENLPERTIQGDFSSIEAYQEHETEKIQLDIFAGTKKELEKIKFDTPKDAILIKELDNKLEFVYKDRRYSLKKEIVGTFNS